MNLNEIETKIYIIEQYLLTLNNKTPHYRDTKRHLANLKKKLFKLKKESLGESNYGR